MTDTAVDEAKVQDAVDDSTALATVTTAGAAHAKATAKAEATRLELYDAIRTANGRGLSVRVIAAAGGVSPGLVQKVVK